MNVGVKVEAFRRFFKLPTHPVAVRALQDMEVETDTVPMRYCEMVRRAAEYGEEYVCTRDNLSCANAEISLGLTDPPYGDVDTRLEGTTGVLIAPLVDADFEPQVVILVGKPKLLMQVSTSVSRVRGEKMRSTFGGETAVCGEATAHPILQGEANLSLLCEGARMFAGYTGDEVAMGIPMRLFQQIAENIGRPEATSAMCGCLMDDLPQRAVEVLEAVGFDKSTDHFFGTFEDDVIRLQPERNQDGAVEELVFTTSLRLPSPEAAHDAEQVARDTLESPLDVRVRHDWMDVSLPMSLGAPIERIEDEKLRALVHEGIETLQAQSQKLKRKRQSLPESVV